MTAKQTNKYFKYLLDYFFTEEEYKVFTNDVFILLYKDDCPSIIWKILLPCTLAEFSEEGCDTLKIEASAYIYSEDLTEKEQNELAEYLYNCDGVFFYQEQPGTEKMQKLVISGFFKTKAQLTMLAKTLTLQILRGIHDASEWIVKNTNKKIID